MIIPPTKNKPTKPERNTTIKEEKDPTFLIKFLSKILPADENIGGKSAIKNHIMNCLDYKYIINYNYMNRLYKIWLAVFVVLVVVSVFTTYRRYVIDKDYERYDSSTSVYE